VKGSIKNKLIVFRDGTILELAAFVKDNVANKAGCFWGATPNGTVDMAVTSPNYENQGMKEKPDAVRKATERCWCANHMGGTVGKK